MTDMSKGEKGDRGFPGASPTGDLLEAVRTLVREVEELSQRLSRDYPTKEQVQHEGRLRAAKMLGFGIVIIIAANLLTIQTISYCFLSPIGTNHSACNYIPGYENTLKTGNERLARFNLLLEQIKTNQEDIKELQQQVNTLKGQG